jgi:hypothetical protein
MARRGTTAKIDLRELEKLCGLQCTDEEIAAWFGVATRTIERRRKVKKFADVMARGKARGRVSVRRMQMKLLEEGNATMGVWLGKNILGQVDTVNVTSGDGPLCILMPMPDRPVSAEQIPDCAVTIDLPSCRDVANPRVQQLLVSGEPTEPRSLESQVDEHLRWRTR